MNKVASYKDLIVWQKSMDLVVRIYHLTQSFPQEERFGLISQLRRSAVSIPSNIAEGSRRGTKKDYRSFVLIAYGSGAELETQIEIAKRLDFLKSADSHQLDLLLQEIMKMLNKLVGVLET
ncbi:MAG: s23 ribosomal protein [Parcubacteria group bacterium Gr01-1014_18]|nr:MAG: s23 ribosomal protein [Parcubacteria group bacterium Greene0416_36]TSC79515.1 MAG: s23 ribosomal protein [Parcubacteria group bacterium Gr01-1014_18]TSC97821.1 MAG: s23 ribosomal protein [Parcubacteria group bacterium Greene1014_20]TSD05952.1 MAG: s23 ribosomal protein [Parcubacteria group bacterium Greene0714_2]